MLQTKIEEALKKSLKRGEIERISTLRLLLSKIKNAQIEKRAGLSDDEILAIIRGEVKERDEAAELYKKGKRDDLAKKEETEKKILQQYLPKQASDREIENIIGEALKGLPENPNFDQVMGQVMGKLSGKADGKRVSEIVSQKLKAS